MKLSKIILQINMLLYVAESFDSLALASRKTKMFTMQPWMYAIYVYLFGIYGYDILYAAEDNFQFIVFRRTHTHTHTDSDFSIIEYYRIFNHRMTSFLSLPEHEQQRSARAIKISSCSFLSRFFSFSHIASEKKRIKNNNSSNKRTRQ